MSDVRIYLSGPGQDGPYPYAWHRWADDETEASTVNPHLDYPSTDERPESMVDISFELIDGCDVVLLRRVPDRNLCRASVEAQYARSNGIPVVVWNDGGDRGSETPLFLQGIANIVCEDRVGALELAESYGTDDACDLDELIDTILQSFADTDGWSQMGYAERYVKLQTEVGLTWVGDVLGNAAQTAVINEINRRLGGLLDVSG